MTQFHRQILAVFVFNLIVLVFSTAQPQKIVLLEEATGTGCVFCPRGNVYVEHMLASYSADRVAYVAVHQYNIGDPMYFDEYGIGLSSLGIAGIPAGRGDRKKRLNYADPFLAGTDIDDLMSEIPAANVSISNHVELASNMVTVTLSADMFESLSGDCRFGAIIVEDGVTGPAPHFDQSNAYAGGGRGPMGGFENLPHPISSSTMVYNHVARALLGGFWGEQHSLPSTLDAGSTYSYQFTYQIPDDYDLEYMRVIGVLYVDERVVNVGKSAYLNGNDNAPPFFHSLGEIDGFVGLEYRYDVVTHDPDYEDLSISAISIPDWLSLVDDGDGFATLSGIPPNTGRFEVVLQATDGSSNSRQTFDIVVSTAQETWIQVGSAGIGNFRANAVNIDTDGRGNLYTYTESYDDDMIQVFKFQNDDWIQLGEDLPFDAGIKGSFAVSSIGVPIVAQGGQVFKYENSSWRQLGSDFLTGRYVYHPSIAIDQSGHIYAAASVAESGPLKSNRCFTYHQNEWLEVGGEINSSAKYNSLAFKPNGDPILIYSTGRGDYSWAQVSAFDCSQWKILGNTVVDSSDYTLWDLLDVEVAADGSIYALNSLREDQELNIYKFQDGQWIKHTSAIASLISLGSASMTSDSEGDLYVAYQDVTAGSRISVQKFEDSQWRYLGGKGFTPYAKNVRIIMDDDDVPVVVYTDMSNQERTSIKKYKDLTTSINPINIDKQNISIFPNPNDGSFSLNYDLGDQFEIYDAKGRIKLKGTLPSSEGNKQIRSFSLEDWSAGIYFMKIYSGNQFEYSRFVISH